MCCCVPVRDSSFVSDYDKNYVINHNQNYDSVVGRADGRSSDGWIILVVLTSYSLNSVVGVDEYVNVATILID